MASIYIVEDHDVMRQALDNFLSETPDFSVAGTAKTAEDALPHLLDDAAVDLVLVDTSLPGMSGIDLVEKLQRQRPTLRCLVLSGHSGDAYVRRALEAGARGYVLKGDPSELMTALQQVLDGDVYLASHYTAEKPHG